MYRFFWNFLILDIKKVAQQFQLPKQIILGMSSEPTQVEQAKTKKIIHQNYNQTQHQLILTWHRIDWDKVIMSRDWSVLRVLSLYGCKVDDSGTEKLGGLNWPNLLQLDLRNNKIGPAGAANIVKKELPKLRRLRLWSNNIGNQGLQVLMMAAHHLPDLQMLGVDKNSITELGLARMPDLVLGRQLKQLWLDQDGGNKLGSRGAKLLNKADLPCLEDLAVSECALGNQGARHLTKANWPNLKKMNLNWNQINYDGCAAIVESSRWNRLSHITVCHIPICVLCYVGAEWSKNCSVGHQFEADSTSQLQSEIHRVINQKFPSS